MAHGRGKHSRSGGIRQVTFTIAAIVVLATAGSCRRTESGSHTPSSVLLRVGLGQVSATNPVQGLRQLSQILLVEGLARTGDDGRMQPSLAEGWRLDGRTLTVKLRPNVKFHDGSPVDANVVASIFPNGMRALLGPVFSDVEYVRAAGDNTVEIAFRESSPFLVETLEAPIQKSNGVATGPFAPVPNSTTELAANQDYYLGPPSVRGIRVEAYPSVRTAWAEMLRDRIDMLWEVGPDALASMQNSTAVSVFTFTRRYQYVIVLNPDVPVLRSAEVRRALSLGVDRAELVRSALNGYGVASSGPIWPHYWALRPDLPKFGFDPARAGKVVLGRRLRFTCLIPPDSPFERIALEVKRQLASVGVDMEPQEVSHDELAQRAAKRQYDALLIEVISGPTLLRPYVIWHSNTPFNWGQFGNASIDAALDRVRHSASDDQLRDAVGGLQQAFMDDPPAIFLAWSVRARAVSKRFEIQAEEGRDVMGTMRLWRPTAGQQQASRN